VTASRSREEARPRLRPSPQQRLHDRPPRARTSGSGISVYKVDQTISRSTISSTGGGGASAIQVYDGTGTTVEDSVLSATDGATGILAADDSSTVATGVTGDQLTIVGDLNSVGLDDETQKSEPSTITLNDSIIADPIVWR
jgi:hypothetical protein